MVLTVEGYSRKQLARDADALSAVLRARTVRKVGSEHKLARNEGENIDQSKKDPYAQMMKENIKENTDIPPLPYDKSQCMAYIAHRLPGIYSCNYRVLHEIKDRFPDFQPRSFIDFGSGPGTTIWAASELWTTIQKIKAIEPSFDMMEISKQLCAGYPVARIQYLQPGNQDYDLVMASYALSELADDQSRLSAIRTMWSNVIPGGFLVLVEPGTPVGFNVIRSARTLLMDLHGLDHVNPPHIIAPCTHTNKCPMGSSSKPGAVSWCHFTQRVQRIDLQTAAKRSSGASRNFENEKFSYIIISKGKPSEDTSGLGSFSERKSKPSPWSRLIKNPMKRGGHVIVDVCDPRGSNRYLVSKKDSKQLYRSARHSTWGDVFNTGQLREVRDDNKINNPNYRPWFQKMLQRKVNRGEMTRAQMEDMVNSKGKNRRNDDEQGNQQYPHDM